MCHVTVICIAIAPLTSEHTAAGILIETELQRNLFVLENQLLYMLMPSL